MPTGAEINLPVASAPAGFTVVAAYGQGLSDGSIVIATSLYNPTTYLAQLITQHFSAAGTSLSAPVAISLPQGAMFPFPTARPTGASFDILATSNNAGVYSTVVQTYSADGALQSTTPLTVSGYTVMGGREFFNPSGQAVYIFGGSPAAGGSSGTYALMPGSATPVVLVSSNSNPGYTSQMVAPQMWFGVDGSAYAAVINSVWTTDNSGATPVTNVTQSSMTIYRVSAGASPTPVLTIAGPTGSNVNPYYPIMPADVAVLNDGSLLVAIGITSASGSGTISAIRQYANGVQVGSDIAVGAAGVAIPNAAFVKLADGSVDILYSQAGNTYEQNFLNSAVVTKNFTSTGAAVQVNVTANEPLYAIAALAGGSFAVAMDNVTYGANGFPIFPANIDVRVLNPQGIPTGSESNFPIATAPAGYSVMSVNGMGMADGSVVVATILYNGATSSFQFVTQHFAADGTSLGAPLVVVDSASGSTKSLSNSVARPTGGFDLVVGTPGANGSTWAIQAYSADGVLQSTTPFAPAGASSILMVQEQYSTSGAPYFTYWSYSAAGNSYSMYVLPPGSATPVLVGTSNSVNGVSSGLAMYGSGQTRVGGDGAVYVIAPSATYTSTFDGSNVTFNVTQSSMTLYRVAGGATTQVFTVNGAAGSGLPMPATIGAADFALLADGTFLVALQTPTGGNSSAVTAIRRYSAAGVQIGSDIAVGTPGVAITNAAFVSLANGTVDIVYSQNGNTYEQNFAETAPTMNVWQGPQTIAPAAGVTHENFGAMLVNANGVLTFTYSYSAPFQGNAPVQPYTFASVSVDVLGNIVNGPATQVAAGNATNPQASPGTQLSYGAAPFSSSSNIWAMFWETDNGGAPSTQTVYLSVVNQTSGTTVTSTPAAMTNVTLVPKSGSGNDAYTQMATIANNTALVEAEIQPVAGSVSGAFELVNSTGGVVATGSAFTFSDGFAHVYQVGGWNSTLYAEAIEVWNGASANTRLTFINGATGALQVGPTGSTITIQTNLATIRGYNWQFSGTSSTGMILLADGTNASGQNGAYEYLVDDTGTATIGAINGSLATPYTGAVIQDARLARLSTTQFVLYWVDSSGLHLRLQDQNLNTLQTFDIAECNSASPVVAALGDGRLMVEYRVATGTGATQTTVLKEEILDTRTSAVLGTGTIVSGVIAGTQFNDGINLTGTTAVTVAGGGGNDTFVAPSPSGATPVTIYGGTPGQASGTDLVTYGVSPTPVQITLSANSAVAGTVVSNGVTLANLYDIADAVGSTGADTLVGSTAANVLEGGGGSDTFTGGGGADVFYFQPGDLAAGSVQTITDYQRGVNEIRIEGLSSILNVGIVANGSGGYAISLPVTGGTATLNVNAQSGGLVDLVLTPTVVSTDLTKLAFGTASTTVLTLDASGTHTAAKQITGYNAAGQVILNGIVLHNGSGNIQAFSDQNNPTAGNYTQVNYSSVVNNVITSTTTYANSLVINQTVNNSNGTVDNWVYAADRSYTFTETNIASAPYVKEVYQYTSGNVLTSATYYKADGSVYDPMSGSPTVAVYLANKAAFDALRGLSLVGANRTIPANNANSQSYPSVNQLAGGGAVVTWSQFANANIPSTPLGQGNLPLYARFYDASGNAVSGDVRLDQSGSGYYAHSLTLSNGSNLIYWESNGDLGGNAAVRARLFSSAGVALSNEITIAASGASWKTATATASGFAIGWYDGVNFDVQLFDNSGGAIGSQVSFASTFSARGSHRLVGLSTGGYVAVIDSATGLYGKLYDANGAAVGSNFQISSFAAEIDPNYQNVDAAHLGASSFIVAWADASTGNYDIHARIFGDNGQPQGAEFIVNSIVAGDQATVALCKLSNGNVAVSWLSNGQAFVRILRPDGTALAPEVQVSSTSIIDGAVRLAAGLDGSVVVSWDSNDGSASGVFARGVDANGAIVGLQTQLNTTVSGDQLDSGVVALGNGTFLNGWEDRSLANGLGAEVVAQTFISGAGFAIVDTAARISASLNQLVGDAKINAITISDNGPFKVSVAQLTSAASVIGKLQNANGQPYQLRVDDMPANILANLPIIAANTHVTLVVTSNSAPVNVSVATFLANKAALDKLSFGFGISDTQANIQANLAAIQADGSHLRTVLTEWNGAGSAVLPVTNAPGTTILTGRAYGQFVNGAIQLWNTYYENFPGANVTASYNIDTYQMNPLGVLTSGPTLNSAIAATSPAGLAGYYVQSGQAYVSPQSVLYYWDKINADGSYNIYYSITNEATGVSTPAAIVFSNVNFPPPPTSYAPRGNVGNTAFASLGNGDVLLGAQDGSPATGEKIWLALYNGATNSILGPHWVADFSDGQAHPWALGTFGANYALAYVTYTGSGASQTANIVVTPYAANGDQGNPVTFATGLASVDQISWSWSGQATNGPNTGIYYWMLAVDGADASGNRLHSIYQADATTGVVNSVLNITYTGTVYQEARIVGGNPGAWVVYWVDGNGLTVNTVNTYGNVPTIMSSVTIPQANGIANVSSIGDGRLIATWRVTNIVDPVNGVGNTSTAYTEILDTRTTALLNTTGTPIYMNGTTAYVAGTAFNDIITHIAGTETLAGGGGVDTYTLNTSIMGATIAPNAAGPFTVFVSVNADGSVKIVGPDGTDTLYQFSNIQFTDGSIAINGNVLTQSNGAGVTAIATYNVTGKPYVTEVDRYAPILMSAVFYNADGSVYYDSMGPNPLSVATYLAVKNTVDQIGPGVMISDTAANISAALDQLASDARITSITVSDNARVTPSVAQLASDASVFGKLHNANSSTPQLWIIDTAANIQTNLAALQAAGPLVAQISTFTGGANNVVQVSVATFLTYETTLNKYFGGLATINGVPNTQVYGAFAIADTAANIQANIAALAADAGHFRSLVTAWDGKAPITLPVTNAAGTTAMPGKAFGPVVGGGIQLVESYFQNYAGANVPQPVYDDIYTLDMFGNLVSGPTLEPTIAGASPIVATPFGNQGGRSALGGGTTNIFTLWDSRNSDGTYNVYYDVATPAGAPVATGLIYANLTFPTPPAYAPFGNELFATAWTIGDGTAMIAATTVDPVTGAQTLEYRRYNAATDTFDPSVTVATFSDGQYHQASIGQWGANYALSYVTFTGAGAAQVASVQVLSITPAGVAGAPVTFATNLQTIDQLTWSYVGNQAAGNNAGPNYWVVNVDGQDAAGNHVAQIYQANAQTGQVNGLLTINYVGTVTQEARVYGGGVWTVSWIDGNGLTIGVLQTTTSNVPELAGVYNIPQANSVDNIVGLGDGRILVTWRDLAASGAANGAGNTSVEYAQILDTRPGPIFNAPGVIVGNGPVGYIAGTIFNDRFTHITGGTEVLNGGGGTDAYVLTYSSSQVTVSINADGSVRVASTPDSSVDTLQQFSTIQLSDASIAIAGNTLTQTNADGTSVVSTFNIPGQGYTSEVKRYDAGHNLVSDTLYKADGTVYTPFSGTATVQFYQNNAATLDAIPGGFVISDTAANIIAALDQLAGDAKITSIKVSDNTTLTLTAGQVSSGAGAFGKLQNGDGSAYHLAIVDSAANVRSGLAALSTVVAHIDQITAQNGVVTVPVSLFLADRAVLDKIVGGFAIVDDAAPIGASAAAISSDAHVLSLATSNGGVVSLHPDNSYDVRFATGGLFQGLAYSSYDLHFTAAGVNDTLTTYDAGGVALVVKTFGANGGYAISINGSPTYALTVAANGTYDQRYYTSGTLLGLAYASYDAHFTASGFSDALTTYDAGGVVLVAETFSSNGGYTTSVNGVLTFAKTVNADTTYDQRYYTAGVFLGLAYASYDAHFTAAGFNDKLTTYDANGVVLATESFSPDGGYATTVNGSPTFSKTMGAGGAYDEHYYTSGSLLGVAYASYDLHYTGTGFKDVVTTYDANGVVLVRQTFSPDGGYTTSINGSPTFAKTMGAGGAYDEHYYNSGNLLGVAYASYDLHYTGTGFKDVVTTYDANGVVLVSETFSPDGGYTTSVNGSPTFAKTVGAGGAYDEHYYNSGSLLGVAYVSYDLHYTGTGFKDAVTTYDANGVELVKETFSVDGGYTTSANGVLTFSKTINGDGSYDQRYYTPGAFLGLPYASYDAHFTLAGFNDKLTTYDANGVVLAVKTFLANGGYSTSVSGAPSYTKTVAADLSYDEHYYASGTMQGLAYASYDFHFTAAGVNDKLTTYDANGVVLVEETFTANGGYAFSVNGSPTFAKTVASDTSYDQRYYTAGTFQGLAYASYDDHFTAAGVNDKRTTYDANGVVQVEETFTANGGYALSVNGSPTYARTVAADHSYDQRYYTGGTFQGLAYASYDTHFTAAGVNDKLTTYDANGVVLVEETFTANGGYALSVNGSPTYAKTVAADLSYDQRYYESGTFLGLAYASYAAHFTLAGVNDKLTTYDANGVVLAVKTFTANGGYATSVNGSPTYAKIVADDLSYAQHYYTGGTFLGLVYASYDLHFTAAGVNDAINTYAGDGTLLATKTFGANGGYSTALYGVMDFSKTVNNDGTYEQRYYNGGGTFLGQAYSFYGVHFTVGGFNDVLTTYDAGGVALVTENFNSDGSYSVTGSQIQGQSYTSYQNDYDTTKGPIATAFDNNDGTGTINLLANNLTLASAQPSDTLTSGVDVFSIRSHATETINASGATNETFQFASGFGNVTINGFDPSILNGDHVAFGALFADFAGIQTAMSSSSGNTTITDSAGDKLTFAGVASNQLKAQTFGY